MLIDMRTVLDTVNFEQTLRRVDLIKDSPEPDTSGPGTPDDRE